MMGRDDASDYEKPAHKVQVSAFLLDEKEATNFQYKEFVDTGQRSAPPHWINNAIPPGGDLLPVNNVTWNEADAYCQWRGKRLPTEAEWEYAARGKNNLLYPYGGKYEEEYSSASSPDRIGKLSIVGSYPRGASPFGMLDMAGNVAEWTATLYTPYPDSPAKPDNGNYILRGGSYINPPKEQTATERRWLRPQDKREYVGFRCAMNFPNAAK